MPSKVLEYDSPYFTLFRRHPDYKSLRVFGCLCYPFIRPYNTHKLQYRSVQCLFLGYSLNHKGFLCLDYATGRVYITPHVVFDESTFPLAQSKSSSSSNDTSAEGSTPALITPPSFPCLLPDSKISHASIDSHSLSISESPIPTTSSSPLDTSSSSPAIDLSPKSVPEPQITALAPRMTTRSMRGITKKKTILDLSTIKVSEPSTLKQAFKDPNWTKAMEMEIAALH